MTTQFSEWKKWVWRWLPFFVTALLTLFLFATWFNNVTVTIQQLPQILNAAPSESKHGIFPVLDGVAVDFTTVSTLIPFVGFVFVSWGVWTIIRQHDGVASATFPFVPGYSGWNVAHGLIGTVFGCIAATAAAADDRSWELLFRGMYTALWSTAVAFVWVFTVANPVIGPVMRWWYNASSTNIEDEQLAADKEVDDFAEALKELTSQVKTLSTCCEELGKQAENIDSTRKELEDETNACLAVVQTVKLETVTCHETTQAVQSALDDILDKQKALYEEFAEESKARSQEFLQIFGELRAERDSARRRAQVSVEQLSKIALAFGSNGESPKEENDAGDP